MKNKVEPTEEELAQEAIAQAEYESMIAGLEAEAEEEDRAKGEWEAQQAAAAEAEAEYYSQQGPDY